MIIEECIQCLQALLLLLACVGGLKSCCRGAREVSRALEIYGVCVWLLEGKLHIGGAKCKRNKMRCVAAARALEQREYNARCWREKVHAKCRSSRAKVSVCKRE